MAVRSMALRDAAAGCQRDLHRVAAELKDLGEYPSTKDVVKHLQSAVDALERFARDVANAV